MGAAADKLQLLPGVQMKGDLSGGKTAANTVCCICTKYGKQGDYGKRVPHRTGSRAFK